MTSFSACSDVPLLPRTLLFGNPQKMNASISPDGQYLGWVAPVDGVMNLWIAPRENLEDARPLTHDRYRGIQSYAWARDGVHLLYNQDNKGDENHHLYAITLDGSEPRDLTPYPGSRGLLTATSKREDLRGTVLVSLNQRDPRYADLYRLDLKSGVLTVVLENPGFSSFIVDANLEVRLAVQAQRDGSTQYLKWKDGQWLPWLKVSAEDSRTTYVSHLGADGDILYLLDSRGRDKAALVSLPFDVNNADDLEPTLLAEHLQADIGGVFIDQDSHRPLYCSATYERTDYLIVDDSIRPDIEFLDRQFPGTWGVSSRSEDDRYWIVGFGDDRTPGIANLYDRNEGRIERIYLSRPELAEARLARMQHTVIQTRDGLSMVSYLTLPVEVDDPETPLRSLKPVPLVLLVHGGPWARDGYGFNTYHQWLANRGYAVLSVNFRSSVGFGKRFVNAGNLEWGGKMDDDLCDGVDWAIAQGIADPARIAIMGGSYGGYATLWAMTQHAERYACGVDIVGPSSLQTLLNAIPDYWESFRAQLYRSVGDPGTQQGRDLLQSQSPLNHAHRIQKPLLIGQGANDPRVKQAESDQMVAALVERAIPVTYALFPDEGHGFSRPANNIAFNAITERFLARHLGGRFQDEEPGEAEGNTAIVSEPKP
ncbi:peptidase S9 [Pectobacterium araliae]|uniref:S9 family peptidase n=1 Tax=Pectobacterium araliae TaxID=3073862 RepID=A0AAN0MLT3_9GAMM|nr:S9 family peptidase [Pectobacterium sp. MAFF 302110]GKW20230.1 peptidase S9 [Pectobacterium carotovorum subsp. carotovorum]